MNDNTKTLAFLGAAGAAIALAWTSMPQGREATASGNKMGQALFDQFDGTAATAINITEVDQELQETKSIEVAQSDKGWFIKRSGKADYPADADNQLQGVSTVLLDISIVDVASEGSGEHAKFGVLDPNSANPQDRGIGKYMALKSSTGSSLAELIIGNEVQELPGLRYVRKPGEDTVYMAELENVNNVSTKFVDWVEKDFLDLDKWDVKRVTLDNYDVNIAQGKINRTGPPHVLDYDSSEWKLSGKPLTDAEELDKEKLDSLKDALDDLKIIDVESKPQILVENLKRGNEFFKGLNDPGNRTVVTSLQSKGFYTIAVKDAAGQQVPKIVSNKGEILVGMKDAVEYVLRFGETYRGPEDDENATGDSRYIYAFARVNESLLDPPELEAVPSPLPEKPAPLVKPGTPLNETNATLLPPPSEEKKNGDKGDKGKDGEKGASSTSTPPPAPGPPPNIKPPSTPPTAPPPPPPAQQPSPPSSETNGTSAASSIATDPDAEYAKMRAQREADIARVNAENARKQKEYTDKVTKAQARVKELNEKLAGWYYVISNDVYEKIRLERTDFVKSKKKEEGEEGDTATPKEVAASHVLVAYKGASRADPSITRSKEEAKTRADSLRKQIVDEAKDFATVARENSDGPSKTKGGDLGKFTFETMAKAFSEAAFALDVDGVSEVVETPFGFHIIKRTE
ncbi:MAG: peptidylprolyl isomerase [Verrucomicrobia bacterium]|nr:peptidylprolyl isomerase [Verrucomicrobiota bacterium]